MKIKKVKIIIFIIYLFLISQIFNKELKIKTNILTNVVH